MSNDDEVINSNTNPMQSKKRRKQPKSRKKLFIIVASVVVLALIASVGTFQVWRGSPAVKLMTSIQNSVKLQQQKFTVSVTHPKTAAGVPQNTLSLNAEYHKGQGISADAVSNSYSDLGETSAHTKWVIDSANTIYLNHVGTNLTYNDKGKQRLVALKITAAAMNGAINRETNQWSKIGTSSASLSTTYGFDPCLLSATYHILNDSKSFTDLVSHLSTSDAFSVTQSGLSDVTVSLQPDTKNDSDSLYAKSDLHAFLAKCNAIDFGGKSQTLSSILNGASVDVKIDLKNTVISDVTITATDGTVMDIKLASASGVTVSTPKVAPLDAPAPGETVAQFIQRTQPFLYNHVMNFNQVTAQLQQQARQAVAP